MAIERLSFPLYLAQPEGALFMLPQQEDAATMFIARHYLSTRVLAAGEYDLTPQSWIRNLYNHQLLVLPNGSAVYRTIPKTPNSASLRLDSRTGTERIDNKNGGRIIRIPEDSGIIIVGGKLQPDANSASARMYEIVYHTPGPSPTQEIIGSQALQ